MKINNVPDLRRRLPLLMKNVPEHFAILEMTHLDCLTDYKYDDKHKKIDYVDDFKEQNGAFHGKYVKTRENLR